MPRPSALPSKDGVLQVSSMRNGKPAILRSGQVQLRPRLASRASQPSISLPVFHEAYSQKPQSPTLITPTVIAGSISRSRLGRVGGGSANRLR